MTQDNIINSWTLFAFASQFGKKIAFAKLHNKETGEPFTSLAFRHTKEGNATFVGFSKNLGVLNKEELKSMRNDLQVVELPTTVASTGEERHHYKLCKQGSAWEEVDLFD